MRILLQVLSRLCTHCEILQGPTPGWSCRLNQTQHVFRPARLRQTERSQCALEEERPMHCQSLHPTLELCCPMNLTRCIVHQGRIQQIEPHHRALRGEHPIPRRSPHPKSESSCLLNQTRHV